MQECKGSKSAGDRVAEKMIFELVRSKIVPDLITSTGIKRERISNIMADERKYNFHESDISSLTKYLIEGDAEKVEGLIASHRESGCPVSTLILCLLSPAAQRMGEQWSADKVSFAEVTLGMMDLHTLLRSSEKGLGEEFPTLRKPGKILLSVMPGGTHIFGIAILQSFFVANGWKVDTVLDPSSKSILDRVSGSDYDIVGLSVSTSGDLDKCTSLLRGIREKSNNKQVSCMVGGIPFIQDTDLCAKVGADYAARDAFEALAIAASICEKKQYIESSRHHA